MRRVPRNAAKFYEIFRLNENGWGMFEVKREKCDHVRGKRGKL